MQRYARHFALLLFALLLFADTTELSMAQNLKPSKTNGAATDVKNDLQGTPAKPAAAVKPRLDDTGKMKFPDPVITRLDLDSDCRVTGYIQNRGRLVGIDSEMGFHLKIRIWFTIAGETREQSLGMNRVLADSYLFGPGADIDAFLAGRPVQFRTVLKLPETATVFAEMDPDNRIQESPAGEANNRFQSRLIPTCLQSGPAAQRVDPSETSVPTPSGMRRIDLPKQPGAAAKGPSTAGGLQPAPPILGVGPKAKAPARIGIPTPMDAQRIVFKEGGPVALRFRAPTLEQHIAEGTDILVDYQYLLPVSGEVVRIEAALMIFGPADNHVKDVLVDLRPGDADSLTPEGNRFKIPWREIPKSALNYSDYRLRITCFRRGEDEPAAEGISPRFKLEGTIGTEAAGGERSYDPSPVSNSLHIVTPAVGDAAYIGVEADIAFVIDIPYPEGSRLSLTLSPYDDDSVSLGHEWRQIQPSGRTDLWIDDNVAPGRYRIHGKLVDVYGVTWANGTSGVFRLERQAQSGASGGLEITSPTAANWYRPGDILTVSYRIGSCDAALISNCYIFLELRRSYWAPDRYALMSLGSRPLEASGTITFTVPPEVLSLPGILSDYSGYDTNWRIVIYAGDSPLTEECKAASASFRISL